MGNDVLKVTGIVLATIITFIIVNSCTNSSSNDPLRSSTWINVETGVTDSTIIENDEAIKKLIKADSTYYKRFFHGFNLSWKRVDGASFYEVRFSNSRITSVNWDQATFALKVNNSNSAIIRATFNPKPEINPSSCTGCEICIKACPNTAIDKVNNKAVINLTKCTGCGVCYSKCPYKAIVDRSAGRYYYFAVRAYSNETEAAKEITVTSSRFKLYMNNWFEHCQNCFNFGCHPTYRKDCPVSALYDKRANPNPGRDSGLIYINLTKCINCGRCIKRCVHTGLHGSLRMHVAEEGQYIEQ